MKGPALNIAREELTVEGLIEYRKPYWQVRNILQRRSDGNDKADHTVSSGRPETELLSDTGADRDFAKASLEHISRILSKR